jgi:hypothetical protein
MATGPQPRDDQQDCSAEAVTAGEADEITAGCGVLTIVGRLDRGAPLAPVLAALRRRSQQEGPAALRGAETLYRTRLLLNLGDPDDNRRRAAGLAAMAEQWLSG